MIDDSDHRPVFAQFLLKVDLSDQGSEAEDEVRDDDAKSSLTIGSQMSRMSRAKTKVLTESQL